MSRPSGVSSQFVPAAKISKTRKDWNTLEKYIQDRSLAQFSHGMCPICMKKLYPEICSEDDGKDADTAIHKDVCS